MLTECFASNCPLHALCNKSNLHNFSGHGPFSHLFDGKFIPFMDPSSKWKVRHLLLKLFSGLEYSCKSD